MQGLDIPGGVLGGGPRDALQDFDALDVDGLLNYFNQPGPGGGMFSDPSFTMGGPSPFRPGPVPGMPGMHVAQPPQGVPMPYQHPAMMPPPPDAANLFSSVRVAPPDPSKGSGGLGGNGVGVGVGRGAGAGGAPSALGGGGGSGGLDDSDDSGDDDGRGTKRTAEQKAHAIQEKNRRAQKRFRERQKAKMKDMTEQLDDMGSELSRLRLENNALKNRNSILEKVLALRDEHIRMLQDEQQVFDLGNHYLASGPGKLLGGGAGAIPLLPASAGAGTDGGAGAAIEGAGGSGDLAAGGAFAPSALVASEIRAVKSMPAEAVVSRWKEMVRELGNILVQIEGCPDESDPRRAEGMANLCRVLDAAGRMCMHTAVLHPTNMQRLVAMALDDGRSGVSAEDRARWASVTASLALSPDQKSQIVSLRRIFLRRMARVVEERRTVLAKLQSVHIPDRMLALQSVINETLKVNECTVKLKANLQEEHLAGMEFIGTVFKTVFGKLQKARAIVQSYPYYPDIYQISTLLAIEREGTAAIEGGAGNPAGADAALVSISVAYRA